MDVNASEVEVFVRASDSPHGVVEFTQPVSVVVDEVAATIQVDVVRTLGLVGPLRVNFTLLPLSASLGEDFSITQTSCKLLMHYVRAKIYIMCCITAQFLLLRST